MTIGLLHATTNSVRPMMEEFAAQAGDAKVVNFVDESLLARANRVGAVDDVLLRSFAKFAFSIADSNVDGIIVCCSVFCPFVPLLEPFIGIPIIAVDRPMLEYASRYGTSIGIIATEAQAGPTTRAQIETLAKGSGRRVSCAVEFVGEAPAALKEGDFPLYDGLLSAAAERLERQGCDTIVLCQITMARAAAAMGGVRAKVLTSPSEGVKAILKGKVR